MEEKRPRRMFPHLFYPTAILLVGLSFVGSYTYFRNEELQMKREERAKHEVQKAEPAEQAERQKTDAKLREVCLAEAEEDFMILVRLNGQKTDKGGSYTVPADIVSRLERRKRDARNKCFEEYPIIPEDRKE
jgi:hypothetical protein